MERSLAEAVTATALAAVRKKPYGEARPFELTNYIGELLQDSRAHSEVVTPFVSDADNPVGDVITEYDLDLDREGVREVARLIEETQQQILEGTAKSLRARGLGATFDVYRYGPIRSVVPDVTAVSLNPWIAVKGAARTGKKAYRYECKRSKVLCDIDALWPSGFFAEEELLVDPKGLKRKEEIDRAYAKDWWL